ncbi:MAG: hypothetical protein D3910_01885 [Candidatus Electrothrix sp. ATG2]|nr:hypothetical protein [Candidatus Electrothrix sp. ATG2]
MPLFLCCSSIHENGLETGVLVNGITALVYGNQFVANHVPLSEDGTITVNAFDADGNRGLQSASVTVQPTTRQIELQVDFDSGLAPMENTLKFSKNFIASSRPDISYSGPANMVAETGTEENTWNISMTEPGIYIYTVEVRDENSVTYTDQVAVLANDRVALDTLLQEKWNGMKQALINGDSAGALEEFTLGQRELFQEIFTAAEGDLAQMALDMQDIELIYQKNDTAEYRIRRDIIFKESPKTVTFYIYFQRERDGIWRIRDF